MDVIARAAFGVAWINPDMSLMSVNPSFASFFLAKPDELAGSPITRCFGPDEATWIAHQLRTLSDASAATVRSESQALRADRSVIWLSWSATAVRKPDGAIDHFIALFEDITARHGAEVAAARNLNVLARLNRLKTEFLSTVSHELRTALVGIQGFSELIRDDEALDVAEVRSFADEVYQEARRLDQMLDKMLEIDQAPTSKTIPHITDVDLNAQVHEVVLNAGSETGGHRMVINLAPELPPVKADAAMIRELLRILLSNAIRYSPQGSEVALSSRAEPGGVHIGVKDHGKGMPSDFDLQLFGRRRSSADNPASEVVGSGLGLPMARQIVELHGGKIWFDSIAGVGSEFHFTIPTAARNTSR